MKLPTNEEKIDEFQLKEAFLDPKGTLITKIYSLGRHDESNFLCKFQIDGLQFNPLSPQHMTATVIEQYPNSSFRRNDLLISYVEVSVTQTSTHSDVQLLEGGHRNETVKFMVKGEQTLLFDYMISIYCKYKSDDWFNFIDIRQG